MKTFIVTFQVVHGYSVPVMAADEEAAKAKALAAYEHQALEPDYADFDYFDFCFEEVAP